jgi:hypothetical protein
MASRVSFALLLAAAAALCTSAPAAAKEGVRATLTTAVPLHASPGTTVKVVWTLTYRDEHGRTQPFGAGAVYVRLLSATGAGAKTSDATSLGKGRYSATVAVPRGGIRDVQIALHGFTSGANGTRNADVFFPITNDPLPGIAPVGASDVGTHTGWLGGAFLGACLLVLAFVAASLVRRRVPGAVAKG